MLFINKIPTKLGTMVTISDEDSLYLLEFEDGLNVEQAIRLLQKTIYEEGVLGKSKVSTTKDIETYLRSSGQDLTTKLPSEIECPKKSIEKMVQKTTLISKNTKPNEMIKSELDQYFEGKLQNFTTPLNITGSEFQKKSWDILSNIPYGKTISYLEQAKLSGNSKAFRAIANANAANQFAIIIPCHRVINHNGKFGGYKAGLERKKWLINHERSYNGSI